MLSAVNLLFIDTTKNSHLTVTVNCLNQQINPSVNLPLTDKSSSGDEIPERYVMYHRI